jgi:NAD(P)-dependent dehydrogenase (short-subunit alcohol dehydrogenase family)
MGRLDGKVAIVTGAGRGLGRAMARRFAAEGAKVAVLSLTPANVERVVGEITAAGGTALGVVCDVGDEQQIKSAVAKTVQAFGAIDIVVNNAFDVASAFSSVLDLSVDQLQRQLLTGPIAYLRMMQACYPHLENRDGRVINLASSVGVQGTPSLAPYAMAKEAIRALTRVAAREWGDKGITVNNICPIALTDAYAKAIDEEGMVMPPTAIPRMGDPDNDIAPIALFLASQDSQYMTGYTFMADGGFMIDTAR